MLLIANFSGAVWGSVLKSLILLVGLAVWGVVNYSRKKKVADEFHLDPKVVLAFKGATCLWSEEVKPVGTRVPAWAWFAATVFFIAAFVVLKLCMETARNWEYLLGGSILLFILAPLVLVISRSEVPAVAVNHRCDFSTSRLLLESDGSPSSFEVGSSLLIVVGVDEVVKKRGVGQLEWDEFLGFKFKMSLRDGYRDMTVPMDFVGSGEFLASCQHLGAKVEFDPACPSWFVQKIKALPSWRPGYFMSDTPAIEVALAELVCASCGGQGRYPLTATQKGCQYCGSGKLNPV